MASSLEAGIESPRSGRQPSSFRWKSVVKNIAHRLMFSAKASHAVDAASTGSTERLSSSTGSQTARAGSVSSADSSESFFKPTGWALTGQNQAETLYRFFVDAYGQNDPDLMGAKPKPQATAFRLLLRHGLKLLSNPGEHEANAIAFGLLCDPEVKQLHLPALHQEFQRDRDFLRSAHFDKSDEGQIEQAIKNNMRLWIKANLLDCETEKQQLLKQQFLDQVSLDLNGRPSQATESVGLFSLPDEASVDFEDLGSDDLDSEASFAGMTVAHEGLSSRGSLNSCAIDEVSEANTLPASFDSLSFGAAASSLPLSVNRRTSPFLASDPGSVPANLLAFDSTPEMYSFWRLLSNTHGPVGSLGQEEKNIASFNLLLAQEPSQSPIHRLQQVFQNERNALHQNLGGAFKSEQIDVAITFHIQDWLKEKFSGSAVGSNDGPTNQFFSLVNRCLEEIRGAELLPKANPARLIGSRSSEGSRLSEVAKSFSWFAKPLSAPLRARHTANNTPGVKVKVNKMDAAQPALEVKFTTHKAQEHVNEQADLQLKAAFSPHTFLQGDKSLNAMFLAQLDNSGIDKHLYHQAIRQGVNPSAGGFRLSAQAHGGLMARTLPFMGPKKSLEQKALIRVSGKGGTRLSALADHPKQFSKTSDKVFLTYLASQQALWNKIKPYFVAGDRLFVVPDSNKPIHFNLLHQIGFAQDNLNTDQLVQMGKLVMSAVGADVVRSPMSDADIRTLYQQDGMQMDQPMPLNVNQFRAALGPGRITRGGEKTYGTLGSQVIDLMARLNSKPGKPVSLKEHQMMGNLLTLMVKRQARLELPVAIQKTKVSRQADPFKETLIINLRHKLVNELRGEEPADRLIRDDESMFMVCEAATKAVNKAFAAIAKAGIVGNAPFLDKLKSELRSDADFYAAMNDGLADDIPNLTSERRPGYLDEWMVFLADTAEWIFTRSVHMDGTNRAGQGGNRQSEIQPA